MNATNKSLHSSNAAPNNLLLVGLTAILIGYFLVWLPGPAAGLQIIGIELGEWIKFLGVGSRRDLFYLPPIVIGLILALLAASWPNNRLQTWMARLLAIGIALLIFPPIAAIQFEPRSEWLLRLVLIAFVGIVALSGLLISWRAPDSPWLWLLVGIVAFLGGILSAQQYFAIRPVVEELLRQPIGVGPGVWLNLAGSLLIIFGALSAFIRFRSST